ncbi:MAG: ATP12 family chaperone protein [Alphaproteobacteria bacterium]
MAEKETTGAPQTVTPKAPSLTKRFYKEVTVVDEDGAAAIHLDGRPVRTPGKAALAVPRRALAEAIAEEWRVQGMHIDPATMPLTKLANSAIDGVMRQADAVIDDILAHAHADLLCYRASGPEQLLTAQARHWDPVIAWAKDDLGASLSLTEGIVHVGQPDASIATLKREIAKLDTFGLAALHVMTALTGSALLALAVASGRLSPEKAWAAAHVDEDFQISQWGEDAEAKARRAARKRDFDAAARAIELSES